MTERGATMDTRTLCLGVLSLGEMSGYDIKKCLEVSFRHFFQASYGSIYPALAELARKGYVRVRTIAQEGRPDKKVYSITPAGLEALRAELAGTEPRHRVRSEFLVLMFFAHHLPPERLAEVIDQMIARWERILFEDLAVFEKEEEAAPGVGDLEPGMRFALGFGRTVLAAALAYVRRQRPGLLREIEAQRRRGEPAPAGAEETAGAGD